MVKKDLIDELLYKYGESAFEKKYNDDIENYTNKMEEENIKMSLSFDEFWNGFNNKNIIKKKRRKNIAFAIVASLIFAFIVIGPSNVATFSKEMIQKLVVISNDKIFITFEEAGNYEFQYTIPNYVPENYEIVDTFKEDKFYVINYSNGNEKENINYGISSVEGTGINNDGENAKMHTIKIEGVEVIVIETPRRNTLDCAIDSQIYSLTSTLETEELIKMMESILKQHKEER